MDFFRSRDFDMATTGVSGGNIQSNPTIHYKLVLLGDASVGKSCLVVRYDCLLNSIVIYS